MAMCYSHIIRINPPLIIQEETALEGLGILDEAMETMAREMGLG
jgi:4-aminobutyrate aminotransferase-like enzyme